MSSKLFRIAVGILAVFSAFGAYRAVAVPWIEPAEEEVTRHQGDVGDFPAAEEIAAAEANQRFSQWFAPEAWELDAKATKVLKNGQGILLFREYKNLPDARKIRLKPCTLVMLPSDSGGQGVDQRELDRQAVILEAPDGAILEFENEFNLRGNDMGRLIGGLLLGPVLIRGQGKEIGPHDDLRIVTQEVEMTEKEITTPHRVEYAWGLNHGTGRDLLIELLPDETQGPQAPRVGGIKTLTLHKDVVVFLEEAPQESQVSGKTGQQPAEAAVIPTDGTVPQPNAGPREFQPDEPFVFAGGAPVRIVSQGPFHFDMESYFATFTDQVDVQRLNPSGPSDQLLCELLTLHFKPKEQRKSSVQPSKGKKKPSSAQEREAFPQLELTRIVAQGDPVVITSPARAVYGRGTLLEYLLETRRVSLQSTNDEEVLFRELSNEAHAAKALHYQPGEGGRLGRFLAEGKGWLSWEVRDPDTVADPGTTDTSTAAARSSSGARRFDARWSRQLHARPHDGRELISIEGQALARLSESGQITADDIHAWLFERFVVVAPSGDAPAPKPKRELIPDRALAEGHVVIDSPQLTGHTDKLEAWFQEPPRKEVESTPPAPTAQRDGAKTPGAPGEGHPAGLKSAQRAPWDDAVRVVAYRMTPQGVNESTANGGGRQSPTTDAAEPRPKQRTDAPERDQVRGALLPPSLAQRFDVNGRLLRVKMLLPAQEGQRPLLSQLDVVGEARLTETQTTKPGERPLVITGHSIQGVRSSETDARFQVVGSPARIDGREMTLEAVAVPRPNGDPLPGRIFLDQAANRAWIEGPGKMTMLVARDLQGNETQDQQPLDVTWSGGMVFDGLRATYTRNVVARRGGEQLKTDTLVAVLDRRIDFAAPKEARGDARPQIGFISCKGGAFLQREIGDKFGLTAVEMMQVGDLSINQLTGKLEAQGPGWVRRVGKLGDAAGVNPLGGPPRGNSAPMTSPASPADPMQPKAAELNYLFVTFEGPLEGNIHDKRMTFHDRVQTVSGPVKEWRDTINPDRPEEFGEQGAEIRCDQLTILQVPEANEQTSREMIAEGNVQVTGQTFSARSHLMTYSQAKDKITLEGGSRTAAELEHQPRPGDQRSKVAARKIHYWRSSEYVKLEDAKLGDTYIGPRAGKAAGQ